MKLYRATNRKSDAKAIPAGSCWAEEREHAEAYQRNPGYGGRYLIEIEIEPQYVLDLRGGNWDASGDWSALAEAIGYDGDGRALANDDSYQGLIEQVLDDQRNRAKLGKQYSWVVYHDTYPRGCSTWAKVD